MAPHTETVVPGTVHLVDIAGSLNLKHSDFGGERDIVLLPQPSSDPQDPLNWSKARKLKVSIALLTVIFMGNLLTNLFTAAMVVMEKDTGIPIATLNQGLSVQYLFYGWADVVWVPIALNYGRRPVLLGTAFASIAVAVWAPFVKSGGEWYINRILAGCLYAPIEIVIELSFADMYFVHERGLWISLFSLTLFGTVYLGTIPAGYVADSLGWRWIQYLASIICAGCFIFLFFCLEETMFYRPHVRQEVLDNANDNGTPEGVKDPTDGAPTPPVNDKKELGNVTPAQVGYGEVVKCKPLGSRLKFWGARRPGQPNTFFQSMWLPFVLVRFPVILMSGLLIGSTLCWYLVVASTTALTLSAPPYNFGPNSIGLMFIAPCIGITVGCTIAAVYSNRIAVWLSRSKGGIFEPEYRLWLFVVPALIHVGTCVLWGVGAERGIHWMGLAIALGGMVLTLPIGTTIAINYIIDSYHELAGDALVTMLCIRNTIAFGVGYGVTPWLMAVGVQNLYIAIAFIGLAFWLLALLFIYVGKWSRKSTAPAYWKLVEQYKTEGH